MQINAETLTAQPCNYKRYTGRQGHGKEQFAYHVEKLYDIRMGGLQ